MGWQGNVLAAGLLASLAAPATALAPDGADTPTAQGPTHAAASAHPGHSCDPAYQALPQGTILDLLDPDAPAEHRASALAAYQHLATMKECPEFAYTLGQLYRHGPDLPGNPLPQDLPRARELIRPMAEDGYLPAFADLAEMEMRHANSRETMKWTQVYLYFVNNVKADYIEDGDALHYQRSAYNGNLLARAELIWKWPVPALPRRLVREDMQAYLDEHGAHVTRRMRERMEGSDRRRSAQDAWPVRLVNDPGTCYIRQVDRIGAASASWIVEFMPSGETGRIVLENFVPNPEVTEVMKACLARMRFSSFEGDAPVTVRYSMVMGSGEGASIRRTRRR